MDIRPVFEIFLDCLDIQLPFNLVSVFDQIAKAALFVIQPDYHSLRRLRFRNTEIIKALKL